MSQLNISKNGMKNRGELWLNIFILKKTGDLKMFKYVIKLIGNRNAKITRFKSPFYISICTRERLAEGRKLKINIYTGSGVDYYFAEVAHYNKMRKVKDYCKFKIAYLHNHFVLLVADTDKRIKFIVKRNLVKKLQLKFEIGLLKGRDRGTFKKLIGNIK